MLIQYLSALSFIHGENIHVVQESWRQRTKVRLWLCLHYSMQHYERHINTIYHYKANFTAYFRRNSFEESLKLSLHKEIHFKRVLRYLVRLFDMYMLIFLILRVLPLIMKFVSLAILFQSVICRLCAPYIRLVVFCAACH